MKKTIGEIIRELRKERQITQETLAEALNVSFQSVSRWENGSAYPDITLVPVIAGYFNVSTDTLFGLHNEELEKRHQNFESSYLNARNTGDIRACISIMEEARKEFPRDYHFMMNLAESMECLADGSADQKETFSSCKYASKIRSLCQLVLENCTADAERFRALKLLCNSYALSGNISEAMHLLDGVADLRHCREIMLENILCGNEKMHQLQKNMLFAIDYTAETLTKIAFRKEYGMANQLTPAEKISYVATAIKLYELLFVDGNYLHYHRPLCWNQRRLAELYLQEKDTANAYRALLQAAEHAKHFDSLTENRYTAPFVNTLEYVPENHSKEWMGSERGMLLYRIREMEGYFENASPEIRRKLGTLMEQLEKDTDGELEISIE